MRRDPHVEGQAPSAVEGRRARSGTTLGRPRSRLSTSAGHQRPGASLPSTSLTAEAEAPAPGLLKEAVEAAPVAGAGVAAAGQDLVGGEADVVGEEAGSVVLGHVGRGAADADLGGRVLGHEA